MSAETSESLLGKYIKIAAVVGLYWYVWKNKLK